MDHCAPVIPPPPVKNNWFGYFKFTLGILSGSKWTNYKYIIYLSEEDGEGYWWSMKPAPPPPPEEPKPPEPDNCPPKVEEEPKPPEPPPPPPEEEKPKKKGKLNHVQSKAFLMFKYSNFVIVDQICWHLGPPTKTYARSPHYNSRGRILDCLLATITFSRRCSKTDKEVVGIL